MHKVFIANKFNSVSTVLVIAWVAVKFWINTISVVFKLGEFSQGEA